VDVGEDPNVVDAWESGALGPSTPATPVDAGAYSQFSDDAPSEQVYTLYQHDETSEPAYTEYHEDT